MPYVCGNCDFFDAEAARGSDCPSCGRGMRFTMLDPRPTATATLDEPPPQNWKDSYAHGYEEVEALWSFRYAQIGIGVSTYSFVWFWGRRILFFLMTGHVFTAVPGKTPLGQIVAILILNCIAALAGGAVAGFWVRNWIPQGLGVAGGAVAIPLMFALVLPPESWAVFGITVTLTSLLAPLGAYLGHRVVKPTRIPKL